MVHFKFIEPCNEYYSGCLSVEISQEQDEFLPPFKMQIINNVDQKIKWETVLNRGMWGKYYEPTHSTMILKDSRGEIAKVWTWDPIIHGDSHHSEFLVWAIKNKGSKGIAIGTNDGTSGEWVQPVRWGFLDAILIEASVDPYLDLAKNYYGFNNVKCYRDLITADGGEHSFYESDSSLTNSISREHKSNFSHDFRETRMQSISLNDLIIKNNLQKDLGWLHLDVEGIDDDLIMSLDDSLIKLPDVIIYESLNFDQDRREKIIDWLNSKEYECNDRGWNCIANRKKK